MPLRRRNLLLCALLAIPAAAQTPVQITVDAARIVAPYQAIWNFFGADEPNYTYAPHGAMLLHELSQINPAVPVYFRPHNLLTSGDGSASLKWGSTNVYTEDANGNPVYDWTVTDRLFDNLQTQHIRPMVEIGFMPEALSPHPEPYRHTFPNTGLGDIWTGWAYPPKDYAKWRALIVAYATHMKQRYGAAVDTWKWEVWNEPDIGYFQGTPQEYLKLYDITTGAIRQVLPHAVVGGPGGHRRRRQQALPAALPGALCPRHQRRLRQVRRAARLHQLPSKGLAKA
jgi:xylan 1,4-beta-xylosidase